MRSILTLLPTTRHRQRIAGGISKTDRVTHADTWEELDTTCKPTPPDVVVLDPTMLDRATLSIVGQWRRLFPKTALFVYLSPSLTETSPYPLTKLAFDCGVIGATAMLWYGISDDPASITRAMQSVERTTMQRALDPIQGTYPAKIMDILRCAVLRANANLTPDELAEASQLGRRGLSKTLERYNLPGPLRIVTWGRLVAAAGMLEEPGVSADDVAKKLRFPSGSAFRNTCQRYLQSTPHGLAARGGARWVAAQLPAIMQRATETSPRTRNARGRAELTQDRTTSARRRFAGLNPTAPDSSRPLVATTP